MNAALDTVRFELRRRIKRDVRDDGFISVLGIEHHLAMVTDAFGIGITKDLRVLAYSVAGTVVCEGGDHV